jgi:hypothetical protein
MSYYKYVKRDEKSRVDWGAITTNLVDTLREQEAEREKQREEIDASSRATGEVLSDAPQGANKAASTWILNASSDASQYLMSQNRLLKSGFLDPRDFTVNRQNVENSFKSLQTMAESAHKESQLTQDRINEGKAMNFEGVVGQRLDDFQNFEKTQVYFNPTNGVASIGIKDKDGKLSDDPSKFSTIEGAIAQMQSRYDKLDYTSPLVKWSESIGSDVRVVRENGILTVEDPSVREDVNSSLDDAIGALMVNDLRVLSIAEDLGIVAPDDYDLGATETTWGAGLTDAETTRLSELESMDSLSDSQQAQLDKLISKRNKSSRKVGVSTANDGTVIPKANEALKEAVKERLKKEGMALLDYKQTARAEFAPQKKTAAEVGAGMRKEERVGYVEEMATIFTGSESEAQSALQRRIRTKNEELRNKDKATITADSYIDGDKVVLVYSNGAEEVIGGTGNLKQDALGLYDLLAPETAQTSARELEKYAAEENIPLSYSGEPRTGRIESGIGSADITMTLDDTLITGRDSQGKAITSTYSQFLKDKLGDYLNKAVDSSGQVEREFNNLINQPGFMPSEMKDFLKKEGKPYSVKVSGNKMTITIGDTVKDIDDVYDDDDTGGAAGVAKQVRRVVEEELNRINSSKLTGGRPKFNG